MESAAKTNPTRFLIISDTHDAELYREDDKTHAFRQPLPKADVLLHCGDLTKVGLIEEFESSIAMLKAIDAELKLVIAGNHDISLDEEYYREYGKRMHRSRYSPDAPRRAKDLWTGKIAQQAGIVYLEEGTHTFVLSSGARFTVYASPYQPHFCNWAFPYYHDEDRFNPPSRVPHGAKSIAQKVIPDFPQIDIVMTHGPPLGLRDRTYRGQDVGCPHLLRAVARARPLLHCFGHIHEGWGAERITWEDGELTDRTGPSQIGIVRRAETLLVDQEKVVQDRSAHVDVSSRGVNPLEFGKETLIVNAAIMDVRYRPLNAPWVVDLDLPGPADGS